jgi:hypothetical protein
MKSGINNLWLNSFMKILCVMTKYSDQGSGPLFLCIFDVLGECSIPNYETLILTSRHPNNHNVSPMYNKLTAFIVSGGGDASQGGDCGEEEGRTRRG